MEISLANQSLRALLDRSVWISEAKKAAANGSNQLCSLAEWALWTRSTGGSTVTAATLTLANLLLSLSIFSL